jgi:hypothetical protein
MLLKSSCFLVFLLLGAFAACGGKAIPPDGTSDDDSGTFGREPDASSDGNGFVDPHCPDAAPPEVDNTCDVFAQNCQAGQACYPFDVPPKKACQSEVYGTFCAEVGSGTQGSACDNGAGCATGFVCLITGANTSCAKMCDLGGTDHGCPDGFVCEPIDIPGFAACL